MAYLNSCFGHFSCNWKIHVKLSNDGINGVFDLVITVDKNVLCILVVLKRQVRPEKNYSFLASMKANVVNSSVARRKVPAFQSICNLKLPV